MRPINDFCRCGRYKEEFAKGGIAPCKCHTQEFERVSLRECACSLETTCFCRAEDRQSFIGSIHCLACGRQWDRSGPNVNWKVNIPPKVSPQGNPPPKTFYKKGKK